jgi:hypothetical protein
MNPLTGVGCGTAISFQAPLTFGSDNRSQPMSRALTAKIIPGGRYGTMRDVEQTRRISRRKQYALLAAGKIKAKKDGLHTLIDLPSVDAYQASLPDYPVQPLEAAE